MALNIPNIISDIVEQTAFELGTDIQFKHGTWKDIMKRILMENGGVSPNERFPLVCLVQVFEEKYRADDDYADISLTLLICNLSDANWYSEERYTNNFEPVLFPIYDKLMEVINGSQYFVGYKQLFYEHTKIDDLYLPEGDANKLPEILDGVWVRDLRLRFNSALCPINVPKINTVLDFGTPQYAPGIPVGAQSVQITVTLSTVDAFKDGSTFDLDINSATDVLTISTTEQGITIAQVGDITTVTVTDATLLGSTLTFIGNADWPPAAGVTTGVVENMTNLRPNWLNESNTSDSVTFTL